MKTILYRNCWMLVQIYSTHIFFPVRKTMRKSAFVLSCHAEKKVIAQNLAIAVLVTNDNWLKYN